MTKRCVEFSELMPVHTTLQQEVLNGETVIRVTKKDKIMQFDENTLVKVKDLDFHNGTIRVKMLSRLLPDAPDFARGFIGIVFRVNEADSEFESFYIRPTNAMTTDVSIFPIPDIPSHISGNSASPNLKRRSTTDWTNGCS